MKLYVSQVWLDDRVSYNFSHIFQRRMHEELTRLVRPSEKFIQQYDEDFELMFNLSSKPRKPNMLENEILGPTVFAKDKDVEYTIFLPFNFKWISKPLDQNIRHFALENLFSGIFDVLIRYEIDVSMLKQEKNRIISEVLSDPEMNEQDWG